jgi:hypothetical protein
MNQKFFQSVFRVTLIATGVLLAVVGCSEGGMSDGSESTNSDQIPLTVNVKTTGLNYSGDNPVATFTYHGCKEQGGATITYNGTTGAFLSGTLYFTSEDFIDPYEDCSVQFNSLAFDGNTYTASPPVTLSASLATSPAVLQEAAFSNTPASEKLSVNTYDNSSGVVLFNGTLSENITNGVTLTTYFAPNAVMLQELNGVTPVIQTIIPLTQSIAVTTPNNTSNVPAPTFSEILGPNTSLMASSKVFTAVAGGYEFTDSGVGATSVIVYGPVDATNNTIYTAGKSVYDLCNAPASTTYTTVDTWYEDFNAANNGNGHSGNLVTSGGPPAVGMSWNLAYGAAGTFSGTTYQYGLGYSTVSPNNTPPAKNVAAIVFHYNDNSTDTFQIYCITVSL